MEVILGLSALAGIYTAWFWVLFVAITLFWIAFIAEERGGFSTFFTIVFGAFVAVKWPSLVTLLANPAVVLGGVAGYAVVGVLWARLKWGKFLSIKLERAVAVRDAFLKSRSMTVQQLKAEPSTSAVFLAYVKHLGLAFGERSALESANDLAAVNAVLTPRAKSNKGSIVIWIAYWPASMLVYLLRDWLADLATGIYRMVGGYFQRAADEKFADL